MSHRRMVGTLHRHSILVPLDVSCRLGPPCHTGQIVRSPSHQQELRRSINYWVLRGDWRTHTHTHTVYRHAFSQTDRKKIYCKKPDFNPVPNTVFKSYWNWHRAPKCFFTFTLSFSPFLGSITFLWWRDLWQEVQWATALCAFLKLALITWKFFNFTTAETQWGWVFC